MARKKKKGTFPQIGIGQQPIGKITEKRQEVSKKRFRSSEAKQSKATSRNV